MMDHGNITTADYYVRLEGISAGKTRLNIPNGTFDISEEGDGGVIIDTGFGQTHLIQTAYDPLIAEMKKQIELERTLDPKENVFDFCYQTDTSQMTADIIGLPEITLHLSGLDFVLTRWNIWLDRGDGVVCLTLLPAKDDLTVIGAEHLQNVNVGYDLRKKVISLQNRDCMQTFFFFFFFFYP
ncbi:hypothetical protein MKX03_025225 [Papaver bracteatum]|nr:hypothetical protein MKX03_025225 [Papaver bracteatum]